jgi:ribonuclease T
VTIQPPPPAAAANPAFAPMSARFRGYLPVVVDVETGGFDWNRHALLEIAVLPIDLDDAGRYVPGEGASAHLVPAPGTLIDPKSLQITGIDLDHPFRFAKPEREALDHVFTAVRAAVRKHGCQRAILVGHNAHFDLNFLNAAVARTQHKRNPFHPFSVFDTVTMAGLAYGQTVLARAVQAAGMEWNSEEAHSAVYDTERTAQLFCTIANAWGRHAAPAQPAAADDPAGAAPAAEAGGGRSRDPGSDGPMGTLPA